MAGSVVCYVNAQGETVCYDVLTGEPAAPPASSGYTMDANGNVISPFTPSPPLPTSGQEAPAAGALAPPPGATPVGGVAADGGFVPKGAILDIVRLLSGGAQVVYRPNIAGVAPPPDFITPAQYANMVASAPGGGGRISPTAIYQQQQAAAQNAIRTAEDARQFNEQFGFQKAQFDQRAVAEAADRESKEALTREQLDVQRGNTLLGLGSRPETVIRYLYGLGGRQGPQQLGGVTPTIPGYPGTAALPGGQNAVAGVPTQAAGGGVAPPSLTAPSSVPLLPGREGMLTPQPASLLQNNAASPNYEANLAALSAQNPALTRLLSSASTTAQTPAQTPVIAPIVQAPTITPTTIGFGAQAGQTVNTPVQTLQNGTTANLAYNAPVTQEALQNNANIAAGISQITDPFGTTRTYQDFEYGDGGPIHEPVIGMGMMTGKSYMFGENGVEHVVPEGKTLKDVKGKRPKSRKYAEGGAVGGYGRDYSPQVFNPPMLSDIVSRGYNTPGIPLLPQVGTLTGGGQSLIPSSQSLFQALPSERAAYSGFLTDEAGVMPEDVFDLTRRLAPQVTGLRTPRFAA